jgi:hypothetical protein
LVEEEREKMKANRKKKGGELWTGLGWEGDGERGRRRTGKGMNK